MTEETNLRLKKFAQRSMKRHNLEASLDDIVITSVQGPTLIWMVGNHEYRTFLPFDARRYCWNDMEE